MESPTPTTTTTKNATLQYRAGQPWLDDWVARWSGWCSADITLTFEAVEAPAETFTFLEPEPVVPNEGFVPNPVSHGPEALARMRHHLGFPRWLRAWSWLPGGSSVLRAHYALCFRSPRVSRAVCRLLHGSDLTPIRWSRSRWLFMRLLGLCFVAASLSWCAQVDGLVGENGIAPAGEWLERVQKHAASEGWSDSERFFKVPTGFWDDASGSAQKTVAGVCVVASLLVLLNVAEGWALLVAWFGMLSLMTVGQIFSGYQWDGLLLEAGFVGLFCAHWSRLRPSLAEDRGEFRVSLWAVRALLAKLMFLSGWVKLHSGDLTWLNMTALEYHYWTQPIPASTSWSVHHLPQWFHGVGAWLTVGIELVLPIFVMVGPRRLRVVAAMAFVGVMGAIAMTGNYGFFNLLTVVLCVACLDDQTLDALVPRRWRPSPTPYVHPSRRRRWVVSGLWLATGALVLLSMGRVWMAVDPKGTPQTVVEAQQAVGGLRISNHYGLFARMTLDRPEIMVEGSNDGVAWTPYVFNHKPGPLDRSPSFIGLHMPRLDWQMWFAALRGSCQHARWYLGFVRRLLQGEEAVIRLLSHNPFPEEPPKYIRSRLQHYTFTTPHERAQTGAIWHAEERRPFCPTLQLSPQGRLVRARLTPSSGSQSL